MSKIIPYRFTHRPMFVRRFTGLLASFFGLLSVVCISKGLASDDESSSWDDYGFMRISKAARPSKELLAAIKSQPPRKAKYDKVRDLWYVEYGPVTNESHSEEGEDSDDESTPDRDEGEISQKPLSDPSEDGLETQNTASEVGGKSPDVNSDAEAPSQPKQEGAPLHEELEWHYDPDRRKWYYLADDLESDETK